MALNKRVVAITGGEGFIGKPLVDLHRDRGDEVRVLSRQSKRDGGVHYFQADLTCSSDEEVLEAFVDGADILYHCAGELYDEALMEALHVEGTARLLLAAKGRVGRWVQLSSVGAYGPCRSGVVDNRAPERPQGVYERTKTEADRLVIASSLDYVMLRPSIVFGESMSNRSLAQMAMMIRRGLFFYVGTDARVSYVHVDDVVNALMLCGERPEALGQVYVLSDTLTLERMAVALADGMNVRGPRLRFPEWPIRLLVKIFGRVPRFPLTERRLDALTGCCRYDSSAIANELGFSFRVGLEEAFRRYAQSIRQ